METLTNALQGVMTLLSRQPLILYRDTWLNANVVVLSRDEILLSPS